MAGNKAIEERVHALEKSMGTVVKALREIKTEIKHLGEHGNKQQNDEIQEILDKQKVINAIISKNADAIERIDKEIARREKEASEDDNVKMVDTEKVTEIRKNYKSTKCRYFDKGFCKYRKKCRYSHPEQTCGQHAKFGQCGDERCPHRHPEICKNWQSNSCKRNLKCDFLHVGMVSNDDQNQAHKSNYKCVS